MTTDHEYDNVIKAALRVISATHYARVEDPHADAEQEYSREQLALAARALVQAVDEQPADDQPIGWNETVPDTGLRDRIAQALVAWAYRGKAPEHSGILATVRANAYSRADAVLAVLPAPTDWGAVLREAGWTECSPSWLHARSGECDTAPRLPGDADTSHWHPTRRLADETQQPEATASSGPDRIPLDDLTSDQLDALYDRIDTLEAVCESNKRAYVGAVRAAWAAEAERDRYRTAWTSARLRAEARGEGIERLCGDRDAYMGWMGQEQRFTASLRARITELEAGAVEHRAAHEQETANTAAEIDRARTTESTLARVRRLLDWGPIGTCCSHYLRAALDAPQPPTT
ncbi:hypothetical protein [Streptomyces sp. NPDC060198]|uniref:hypothetical protein n=1 Tax=Streptomyces sp. NPDC060198 TaxID=3347070 RepID=UPI003669DB57